MSSTLEGPDPATASLRERAALQAEAVKAALVAEIRVRGLSQRQLARQLGHSGSYLANLFGTIKGRDPANLRLDTLFALTALLGIDPLDLLARVLSDLPLGAAAGAPSADTENPVLRDLKRVALQAEGATEMTKPEVQRVLDAALEVVADWTRVLTREPRSDERGNERG